MVANRGDMSCHANCKYIVRTRLQKYITRGGRGGLKSDEAEIRAKGNV